jgi:hypothetical protein
MFSNISWQDYFMVVGITLTVYYLGIGLRFYSVELKTLLTGKGKVKLQNTDAQFFEDNIPSPPERQEEIVSYTEDDEYAELEKLLSGLKGIIKDASEKRYVLPELKQMIRKILHQYPGVRTSNLRSSVNEFVVSECENSGLSLTEEQIDTLWE